MGDTIIILLAVGANLLAAIGSYKLISDYKRQSLPTKHVRNKPKNYVI